jgi:hypothetical protein
MSLKVKAGTDVHRRGIDRRESLGRRIALDRRHEVIPTPAERRRGVERRSRVPRRSGAERRS